MQRGATAQPIPIGQPVALVAADLEKLKQPRFVASNPQQLRDSHHMIARLAATGLRVNQIAEKSGYSYARVRDLLASPAMVELIARYREKVDESFVENVDEFFAAATSNMLLSERMIADQLAAADESGELPSLRTLDAISQGRADRFGYGKKSQQTNINVDFASALEKAIARSGKTLEPSVAGSANPPQRIQLVGAVDSSPSTRSTRQLVDQPRPSIRRRA